MDPENNAPASTPAQPSAPAPSASPSTTPATTSPPPSAGDGAGAPAANQQHFDDVERILAFDPFPESNRTGPAPAQPAAPAAQPTPNPQAPATPADGGTPPVAQPPAAPAPGAQPASPAPAAPQVSPELERLRALATQLRGGPAAPTPAAPAAPAAAPAAPAPSPAPGGAPAGQPQNELVQSYTVNIPDGILNAMASDDANDRRQGVTALVAAVSTMIHTRIMNEFTNTLSSFRQELPQTVNASVQQNNAAAAVFQDFYGNYQDLNNPALYPVVVEVTRMLNQELGVAPPWNKDYRDEIARRTYAVLGRPFTRAGGSTAPAAVTTVPPPPPGPAPVIGAGGTRFGAPAGPDKVQADILDTLFGNG